jgi:uncharacterized cupin superfamily protein
MTAHGISHWDDCPRSRADMGPMGAEWIDLGVGAGATRSGLRRVRVDAGRRATPAHGHAVEEELVYVLDGAGLSWQGGETFEIGPGDFIVHLPHTRAHTLLAGEGGLDVLIIGPDVHAEVAYLPRANVAWIGDTWTTAGDGAHPWAREAAAGDLPLPDAPSPRPRHIVNARHVEPQPKAVGDTERLRRDLGTAAGSVSCGLQHVTVAAGKIGCPPHVHSAEEEAFIVLEGDGACLLGDEEHAIRTGSVIVRPPGTGVAHAIRAGAAGITYLAYGDRIADDMCYYPRSNKISFGFANLIARVEKLDYWDGEGL